MKDIFNIFKKKKKSNTTAKTTTAKIITPTTTTAKITTPTTTTAKITTIPLTTYQTTTTIPNISEQTTTTIPSISEQTTTTIPSISEQTTTIPSISEQTTIIPNISEQTTTTIPNISEQTTTIPSISEQTTIIPSISEQTTTIPSISEQTTTTIPSISEQTTTTIPVIIQATTIPTTTMLVSTTTIPTTITPLNVIQKAINTWMTTKIPTSPIEIINSTEVNNKPSIKAGETYCYRDLETMKIVCDNNIGSVDYIFKNPSSYQLNLSITEIKNNNKVTTPFFMSQKNQISYCKLLCQRNGICQGFKNVYDTTNNSYYCDFYKSKINFNNNLKDTTVLKGVVRPMTDNATGNWSYLT